ncbi:MAG: hypothetical protein QQW96_03755 [Tychonema bourrellyi B0820]|nr:hypothetical protein [Tychonema bourrellyi B0820]PJE45243.1 MAG: hypothetical protein CUR32_01185 [Flavobacterium sp.] [Flavobacterium sp. FEMGT703F]
MNNPLCADRILIENTIITVSAIIKANYNPTARRLTLTLINQSELNFRDDSAESAWDYLTSRIHGCTEPLSNWKKPESYSLLQ